tara:strand:- start:144 stop:482 length:339 start_codon:yes stop_codon:yes gene_type:complete
MPRPFLSSPERRRKETTARYRAKKKEELKIYNAEYHQTYKGKRTAMKSKWKCRGLICEDPDALFDFWWNATNCDKCNIVFEGIGNNRKCMDHDHNTGLFRYFLCHKCNVKYK